ncbi:hypothetical protein ACFQ07_18640, partial [Actinomadura adrarensis]
VELVEGRHLEPGARYRLTAPGGTVTALSLTSLDRTGETRIEARTDRVDDQHSWSGSLRSIARPEVLTASGTNAAEDVRAPLIRWSWHLDADLTDDVPRLRFRWDHPFLAFKLELAASPSKTRPFKKGGSWSIAPELTVESGTDSPSFVQLVQLLDSEKLARTYYADAVGRWTSEWNDRIGELTAESPGDAAATFLHDLLTPRQMTPEEVEAMLEERARSPMERYPGH